MRAGLIPRIKAGALPRSDAWKVQILTPGAHPITALAANLLRAFPQGAMAKTVDDLTRDLLLAVNQVEVDLVLGAAARFSFTIVNCYDVKSHSFVTGRGANFPSVPSA